MQQFIIGKILLQLQYFKKISEKMTYKQKIKNELKRTLKSFYHNEPIEHRVFNCKKKPIKKKTFRRSTNFYQDLLQKINPQQSHVLNFYNIIIINQKSLLDPYHDESYMKNLFYFKNIKKIEATEAYLIATLTDNPPFQCHIAQVIERYKNHGDQRLYKLAQILRQVQDGLKINKPQSTKLDSINLEAIQLLNSLGNSAYICRISSNKIAISRCMLQMFGYESEEYIIQNLKFKIPLFEGFSCHMYYEVIMKNLENYRLLMDVLHDRIPLSSFLQNSSMEYYDKIKSKNNIQYSCKMTLGMLSPLITVIKVDQILQVKESISYQTTVSLNRNLRKYCSDIRDVQYKTLQYLVKLPDCKLPQNRKKVADYIDKSSTDEEAQKSINSE